MSSPRIAVLVVLLCAGAGQANAQSLGDAARKAEEGRKGTSPSTLVFDQRDLNPAAAQQELLEFAITEPRWQTFLAADRLVAAAFTQDPRMLERFRGLQATSVKALERFMQREPALLAALATVGADAHEYAFTQLAVGLAVAVGKRPDASIVLEGFPDAVRANVGFLKAHDRDVKSLGVGAETLALRITPLPSPATATASVGASGPATAAADPASANRVKVEDFDFVDFNGSRRRLSDFRGRYVLLDFWGVWCPNCRAEVPYLKDAYAQFRSRGLEIIGMDYEQGATVDQVRAYLSANGIDWTFARAESVRDVIVSRFQIATFPRLMLIDANGGLMDVPSGAFRGAQLAKTLDRVLPK